MLEEFNKRRERQNQAILGEDFLPYKRFFALDHQAYANGVLPAKTKELMGLVASMVLRCNDCIMYHIDRAVAEGATRNELNESMNIALVVGGSIVIPHLRFAFDVLNELLPQNSSTPNVLPHEHGNTP